ncbi:type I-E CRISPR-associated protein Cse2/CasB [SAR202 cluster bacterium AD-804-J14_MRT_500m]|nr:type I-E CRISPR-associated protein Cse2/CasB [SAR202 cluster bacterium AD-804-J14_MRT_500m]
MMRSKSPTNSPKIIEHLLELADRNDRGALAVLRQGLGKPPGSVPGMYRHVQTYIPDRAPREYEDAAYMVAALFATHTSHCDGKPWDTNLGASFRWLAKKVDNLETIERRFEVLLGSRREVLGERLRHSVSLLKSHDIPINWYQLLQDITSWNRPGRPIQRSWARAFWSQAFKE